MRLGISEMHKRVIVKWPFSYPFLMLFEKPDAMGGENGANYKLLHSSNKMRVHHGIQQKGSKDMSSENGVGVVPSTTYI